MSSQVAELLNSPEYICVEFDEVQPVQSDAICICPRCQRCRHRTQQNSHPGQPTQPISQTNPTISANHPPPHQSPSRPPSRPAHLQPSCSIGCGYAVVAMMMVAGIGVARTECHVASSNKILSAPPLPALCTA